MANMELDFVRRQVLDLGKYVFFASDVARVKVATDLPSFTVHWRGWGRGWGRDNDFTVMEFPTLAERDRARDRIVAAMMAVGDGRHLGVSEVEGG